MCVCVDMDPTNTTVVFTLCCCQLTLKSCPLKKSKQRRKRANERLSATNRSNLAAHFRFDKQAAFSIMFLVLKKLPSCLFVQTFKIPTVLTCFRVMHLVSPPLGALDTAFRGVFAVTVRVVMRRGSHRTIKFSEFSSSRHHHDVDSVIPTIPVRVQEEVHPTSL